MFTRTLMGAATVVALTVSPAPAPAVAAVATATLAEKAAALNTLGIPPEPKYTGQKDCDLTISIWEALKGQTNRAEVRAAAVNAFASQVVLQQGDSTPCTLFIRTEVFAAKQRDVAIQVAAEEQDRLDRELKQKAALTIGLTVGTDQLGMALKEFVTELRNSGRAGNRVKAAADTANNGTDGDRRAFLGNGIVTAHEADREEQIRIETENDEALRLKLIEEAARKRALAVLLVAATDGMLAASDRDFITYLWENAPADSAVKTGAERAVLSREPADWNAYIHTGIHEARENDRLLALRKKFEADVATAEQTLRQATADKFHLLAVAARKALAGTPEQLAEFVRVGRYDLDLVTGFEDGEVPLEWTDSPAWTGAFSNVNDCESSYEKQELAARDKALTTARTLLANTQAQLKAEQAKPRPSPAVIEKLKQGIASAQVQISMATEEKAYWQAELNKCMATKPVARINTDWANTGKRTVSIHGYDHSATQSYAYFRALPLNRVTVKPTTTLSYWVFPDNDAMSTCTAVDLVFSDGRNLRDSGAVDQNGNRAHPAHQCGKLKIHTWNKVTVNLGGLFDGRAITTLVLAYDQPAKTGFFQARFDDISITD